MTHDKYVETEVSLSGNSRGAETYTREYWLRLYAGMALQGMLSNEKLLQSALEFADEDGVKHGESLALAAKGSAEYLVDMMFEDDQ